MPIIQSTTRHTHTGSLVDKYDSKKEQYEPENDLSLHIKQGYNKKKNTHQTIFVSRSGGENHL